VDTSLSSVRLPRALRSLAAVALVVCSAIPAISSPGIANAAVVQPFTQTYNKVLYGDFVVVGNGNMRCPSTPSPYPSPQPACAGGADRTNNAVNDEYDMRYADADADPSTFNSSTSRLTVPTGATVDFARLYWAGNTGEVTQSNGQQFTPGCSLNAVTLDDHAVLPTGSPATQALRVTVGSGGTQSVVPQTFVGEPTPVAGQPQYYSASADVASMFTGVPSGSPVDVTVGNIWTPQGLNCFGGWSLTVVYAFPAPDPTYAPAPRQVYVYDGHVRQDSTAPVTTLPISGFQYSGGPVKLGGTAFEGDWGISGDQFQVDGTPLAEPATGDSNNYFISNAQGAVSPTPLNNFSVDAKTVSLPKGTIAVGATSMDLGLATSGDSFLATQLALSVPTPTLTVTKEVCQSTNPAECGATGAGPWGKSTTIPSGSTAFWRITGTNQSTVDIGNATLDDPAEPGCVSAAGTFAVSAGQSVQFYCSTPNVTTSDTNTVVALFVPPGAPPETAPLRSAPDSATADVYGLTVTKEVCRSLNPADCGPGGVGPWASSATIPSGSTAYWRITVTDTGSVPVTGITLNDPGEPSCALSETVVRPRVDATQTVYCATPNVTSAKTNTVTASFVPPNSPPGTPPVTTPPSSATVTVTNLALAKEICTSTDKAACGPDGAGPWAKTAAIPSGATAYWRITVTNTGEADLSGITVNDATEPSCKAAVDTFGLNAGQSTVFYCASDNVTTTTTNTASASYLPPTAPPGSPSVTTPPDSATVDVYGLTVLKQACSSLDPADCELGLSCMVSKHQSCGGGAGPWVTSAIIPVGSTAFWRITITNTGTVPITGISLVDEIEPSCVTAAGTFTLAAGASNQVFCSTPNVTADLANAVTASYPPPGSPPDTPPVVTAPSTASVVVSDLAVAKEVCQSTNAADCGAGGAGPWVADASLPVGSTAFWRITVVNTGGADLTGITLNDPAETTCAGAAGSFDLKIGVAVSFYCSTSNMTGPTTNTVSAGYVPPGAPPDTAPVVVGPATAAANVYGVVVTKEVCRSLDSADCGAGGAGPWATDASLPAGSTAFWRITVTNTGTEDLTDITIGDEAEQSCVDNAGSFSLVQGASTQIYCATTDVTTGMTNTAAAEYTPPGGPLTITPPSRATVAVADLVVMKEVCGSRTAADCVAGGIGPWAKTATVPTGGTAYWRITVDNTGEVDLTGITLTDEAEASCVDNAGALDLAVGASTQVFCSTSGITDSTTNTAAAAYLPPGVPVDTAPVLTPPDSATANTTGLVVTKEACRSADAADCAAGGDGPWAATATVPAGRSAYWRITATNTGSLDLVGITMTDDAQPSCADAAGAFDLLAGATTQFYCSTPQLAAGMTNAVTATFTPPDFPPVTTPPAVAAVRVSNLAVGKEVCRSARRSDCAKGGVGPWSAAATMPTGFTAYWRITVTNTGEVDLTGVTLADEVQPDCVDDTGFDLASGESRIFYCATSDLRSDITNTTHATYPWVDAPPDTPPVVTPTASATVHVSDLSVTKEVCQSARPADCGPDGAGTWGKTTTARPGATAYWRITVTNGSDVTIRGVTVRDIKQLSCTTLVPATLAAGESERFYCATRNVTADLTNTVVARYLRPSGGLPIVVVTPPDSASVSVPRLVVTKRVCGSTLSTDCGPDGSGPWRAEQAIASGATAYWRITVANTGSVAVTATLRDTVEPGCVTAAGTFDLPAGASRDVFCATANVTDRMTNIALAAFRPAGADPESEPLSTGPASARVRVMRSVPAPPIAPASAGAPLAWTGIPVAPLVALGLMTLLVGAALLRVARRR